MSAGTEWGPLARLAGIWEGDKGGDVAFSNEKGSVDLTPLSRARRIQALRTGGERRAVPLRVGLPQGRVPRGSALIAGGTAAADDTTFTLTAEVGSETYGILSNRYLAAQARTVRYEVTVDLSQEGVFTYEETSVIEHGKLPEHLAHTDGNTLLRIAEA